MIRDRVTVQEAAKRLGVKDDAIRKRIQRGTLQHDKGLAGRVYVYLDDGGHANGNWGLDRVHVATQDTLLASLREQIDFLRDELERKDAINHGAHGPNPGADGLQRATRRP